MAEIGKLEPPASVEEAQWRVRVDLAAAHRICFMEDYSEGIFNHLTARVPGHGDRYYEIPFGMHWSEVTASCFMEVNWAGEVAAGSGIVDPGTYGIHAPMHRDLPEAFAVFHTHMPYATALTRLENPEILPIGQTEVGVMRLTCYDDGYRGLATDETEGDRMVRLLGENPGKAIVFMASHGILTLGTIAEAYDRLYYVERAAKSQLFGMWTGQKLKMLPQHVIESTVKVFANSKPCGGLTKEEHHFEAKKRLLDRVDPDYAK